ncbi:hypothetical protein PG994_008550 [Apiospora phragmitis]|uniref:Uncharacterized protein n=1 Tax=Apiospora phragmitis TaxID=2905665 RepID=A0ABR1UHC1_9PEZI
MASFNYASKTAVDRRPPPNKPAKKKGPPRLDPYQRLINRFYEPLRLLHVLGQTRGKHTAVPMSADLAEKSRRWLLEGLAYLLDYGKGGSTTAALGLEGLDTGYTFWIASNGVPKPDKTVLFLQSTISNLRRLNDTASNFTEAQFIENCVEFATPRIKKEQGLLERFIAEIIKSFPQPKSSSDQALNQWLQRFLAKSPIDLCYLAYDQRKSASMKLIAHRSRPAEDESHQSTLIKPYIGLRHLLGRVANHVRAPKVVAANATRHQNFFDEGVSTVKRVRPMDSVPRPEADGLTTPFSILKRMVHDDNPKWRDYREAIEIMDQKLEIGKHIVESYEKEDFRPLRPLQFAFNDRFIACSKPACYCCSLYFKAHPSDPEEPRSHQKIWPSWGPPLVPNGPDGHRDGVKYKHQLHILNKMIESIRKEALNQIEKRVTYMGHHPDSTTGITPSILSDRPLEDRMGSLNIGSPRTDDEGDDSDSSDSIQSISSGSARSPHLTVATDLTPKGDNEHRSWESCANSDPVAKGDDAVGPALTDAADGTTDDIATVHVDTTVESDDEDDDPEADGGAAL